MKKTILTTAAIALAAGVTLVTLQTPPAAPATTVELRWDYPDGFDNMVLFNVWGDPDMHNCRTHLLTNVSGSARSVRWTSTNEQMFFAVSAQRR